MSRVLVILDTSKEINIFLERLEGMPYLDEFLKEAVTTLVDNMGDYEYARGSIKEFIDHSVETHELCSMDEYRFNPDLHREVLNNLGEHIFKELIRHKLYDDTALWFEVSGFLGGDVVLHSTTREDYIN